MRFKRFVPMFIVLAIIAMQLVAEAKPPAGKAMPMLYVLDTCTSNLCFYQYIPAGWHAPKEKPQMVQAGQIYYLPFLSMGVYDNPRMLSMIATEPNEQEKAKIKEKLKHACWISSTNAKEDCLKGEDPLQNTYAICVAKTKNCQELQCLGQCYEPYPSKPQARNNKK